MVIHEIFWNCQSAPGVNSVHLSAFVCIFRLTLSVSSSKCTADLFFHHSSTRVTYTMGRNTRHGIVAKLLFRFTHSLDMKAMISSVSTESSAKLTTTDHRAHHNARVVCEQHRCTHPIGIVLRSMMQRPEVSGWPSKFHDVKIAKLPRYLPK